MNSHLTTDTALPVTTSNWILYSIFDDSDPFYHSDSITGQTPAQARQSTVNRDADTRS